MFSMTCRSIILPKPNPLHPNTQRRNMRHLETKGPAAHAGLQEGAARLTPPVTPAVVTAQINPAAPQNSAAGDSATLAKTATTLDELAAALESFEGCGLKKPQNPPYFPTA